MIGLNSAEQFVKLIRKYYADGQQISFEPIRLLHGLLEFFNPYQKSPVQSGERKGETSVVRVYDFETDAPLIYAAFFTQYGIDLSLADMHWHQFLYLFYGLNEEHKIFKIIQYRTMDLSLIKNQEQKKFYRKMKRMYRLPALKQSLSEQQIGEAFSEAF